MTVNNDVMRSTNRQIIPSDEHGRASRRTAERCEPGRAIQDSTANSAIIAIIVIIVIIAIIIITIIAVLAIIAKIYIIAIIAIAQHSGAQRRPAEHS